MPDPTSEFINADSLNSNFLQLIHRPTGFYPEINVCEGEIHLSARVLGEGTANPFPTSQRIWESAVIFTSGVREIRKLAQLLTSKVTKEM